MNGVSENLLCKVVLLGESGIFYLNKGVGKTSIISRYVNKIFHNNFIPTMGSCFATKTESFNDLGKSIKYEVKYYKFRYGTQQAKKNIDLLLRFFIRIQMLQF